MMFWWIRKHFVKRNPEKSLKVDDLNFIQTVEYSQGYSTSTDYMCLDDINEIVEQYRDSNTSKYPFATTNYNGKTYPMFDLDNLEKYNDFCRNFTEKYVIYQSSPGHYWAFIDKPFDSFSEFLKDPLINDWIVYSDSEYGRFTRYRGYFSIRGWFEELNRQPGLIYESDDLSDGFKEFIKKLDNYFQTTSLELSMLKYKKPDMLNLYKRTKKLERILK